ncbi:TRAP transporter substrate-binding protein [Methylobrevis albus]|uniref:TRAP transporter substrate-binding protein n=1 Tax=Methylobrevis albus TaxID=2793297 RepID=A0A931I2A2_9HYPH|nr:TRAP transporter substrate-binding protein [Methylobrevis albus]MBH0238937.1 TRAP transporter substrate-binding protein [Methylobrevis albus]
MKKAMLAMLALALGTVPALAQDVTIRFGYGLNEESTQGEGARFLAKEIDRLSEGRLKMDTFGGGTLGPDLQMQNALIGGAQEMMVGSTATLVGLIPDFGVWDVPFLFANEKEADHVLDGPAGQALLETLDAQGLVGLVYWENGFRNLTNSVRPIATAEDLAGIKLRVMQNPVFLDTFAATGASPIPLAFSELFTALEMRTVDGQENPVTTIQSSRFFEVQKYLTITNHVYSPWIVLASKSWWDGLSAADQEVIRQAAVASRDFEREYSRAASSKAVEALKAEGMEVTVMTPEELAKVAAMADPVISKVTGALSPEVWNAVQASLAEVRTAN